MCNNHWQMISRDIDDLFGIIRGDQVWLSTVKLPYLGAALYDQEAFLYESCLFTKTDSEVLERYRTLGEAVIGHNRLAKKYNLK